MSPSGLNNEGSNSSSELATLCMKSLENNPADMSGAGGAGGAGGGGGWPIEALGFMDGGLTPRRDEGEAVIF